MNGTYQQALQQVLRYAEDRDYSGYSKFDALNSPWLNTLTLGISPLRWACAQAVYRSPINIRPWLGVKKGRNPKGVGLFALAYLYQSRAQPETSELATHKARQLLDWLVETKAPGYHGACWGYNHPWPNFRFSVPSQSPNLVVTGNVVIALLEAFEQLGEAKYLEVARSSLEFVFHDLNTLIDTPEEKAVSYVPGSDWIVLNNQGLAAVLMAWCAKHTGEARLKDTAKCLIHFLVSQQTEEGAWHYAYPPESSPVKHDNYHTGNVLDWLLMYSQLTGDQSFRDAFERGITFYRDQLFLPNGAPKFRHNRVFPHDIHGSAQGALTFSRAATGGYPEYLEWAMKVLDWALMHLRAADGHFYYQQGRFHTNRTSLMRWNQAWMALGLASTLQSQTTLQPGDQ